MARGTSGYERLAQEDELNYSSDEEDADNGMSRSIQTLPIRTQPYSIFPSTNDPEIHSRRGGRGLQRSQSTGVDIDAINKRLERWAQEIANKFKIGKSKGKSNKPQQLEIYYSVFVPPEGMRPVGPEFEGHQEPPYSRTEFDEVVESVNTAIVKGVHPKLISQGSSGSYFARNKDGKIVAVFKPKDEEPYGNLNPKWTKWLHRNLFPCFFGRSCLIPNLSYVSEAAASYLDRQLRTFLVPYTDLVWLSSKAFHYDYWDRRAFYRRGKPFPEKVGSFQVFLQGFKDANIFLRENPWPDRYGVAYKRKPKSRGWTSSCRPGGDAADDEDEIEDEESALESVDGDRRRFIWTDALQQSFREELEKLVILDYIMRNTDRGLDNWMVKVDFHTQQASIVSSSSHLNLNMNLEVNGASTGTTPVPSPFLRPADSRSQNTGYKAPEQMSATPRSSTPLGHSVAADIHIGAIDNSLAFPWKHPDQWRSFPYGWLFLPVSLIGQPFSQKTRDHFLPILTSSKWWAETQLGLQEIFRLDTDFKERMFGKQLAVLKGQAFNVVETLKSPDQGPLELTRRTRVHVWDDEMEIPVAVPLRVPSSEVRRRREEEMIQEEMDISAAVASAPVTQGVNANGSRGPADIPSASKFALKESSREGSENGDIGSAANGAGGGNSEDYGDLALSTASLIEPGQKRHGSGSAFSRGGRHSHRRTDSYGSRFSFDDPFGRRSARQRPSVDGRKRGYSVGNSQQQQQQQRGSTAGLYDDDEGDLGFSAAEGMEDSRRKVIVERLEAVKSKPPVFTWC